MTFIETFEAPHLGMDTESAPTHLAKGYARNVENAVTGRQGRLPLRGAISLYRDWSASGKSYDIVWPRSDGTLRLVPTDGTRNVLVINPNGVSGIDVAPSDATVPGVPFVSTGSVGYGVARDGSFACLTGGLTAYVHAPKGARAVSYWKNRVWCLGGISIDGGSDKSDRIYWSDLIAPNTSLTDVDTTWVDDVSGLTNQIVLASVGSGNDPIALGPLPRGQVVFGAKTADLLIGDTPASLTLRGGAINHGCVDQRTVVEYNDGVMWLAPDGFYFFDGVTPRLLSGSITSALIADIEATMSAVPNKRASAILLPRDHVLLSFAPVGAFNGSSWLVNLSGPSWTRFSSTATLKAGFTATTEISTGGLTIGVDASRGAWLLDSVPAPDTTAAGNGSDTGIGGSSHPITLVAESRHAMLSTPSVESVVDRLSTTVVLAAGGTGTCELIDADDTSLGSADLADAAATTRRRMVVKELFKETHEARARHTLSGSNETEVGDTYLEYQPAQKPASF